jgi:hypothetical protein
MEAVEDCIAAKIRMVWLHDALSPGAAIPAAIDKLRSAGCTFIPRQRKALKADGFRSLTAGGIAESLRLERGLDPVPVGANQFRVTC